MDGDRTDGTPAAPNAIDLREAANAVFASSALVDVLIVLAREPDRPFYVNELIKVTGRFPRSIQLALAKLEGAGLVHSERRANARFYRMSVDHPFFPELRSMAGKICDPRVVLAGALSGCAGVRAAFVCSGETEATTIDLVVVGDVSSAEFAALARKYFEPLPPHAPPPVVDIREPEQRELRRVVIGRPAQLPVQLYSFHVPASNHPDYLPLQMLGAILSEGRSSRL